MLDPHDVTTWRILVTDNEPDSLTIVKHVLTFKGADCLIVGSGQQCLEQIDQYRPNMMLLDIQMPGMSGWQLIMALRADTRYARLPVIALTAHAMSGDRERILQAGFTGYFAKPISPKTLTEDIHDLLMSLQEELPTDQNSA